MLSRRAAIAGLAGCLAAPAFARSERSPAHRDLVYSSASPRNVMDVHMPSGKGPFPVLLDIHGGGFLGGDKRDLAVPSQVLSQGIAIARMNYRLSGQARWPSQHEDVLAAVAFLRRHGGRFDLMTEEIALGGRSAGAFLAVSAAISLVQAGDPPAAVVNFYGPMDFGRMDSDMARLGLSMKRRPADSAESVESLLVGYAIGERREEASAMGPVGRLSVMATGTRLPPLMIRHGTRDTIVAADQARHLLTAWHRVDPETPVDFALLPQDGHGTAGFGSNEVLTDLAGFLTLHLG